MMSRVSPCLHCKKRKIGCHSTCAEYLEYSRERKMIQDERAKQNIYAQYQSAKSVKIEKQTKNKRENDG